jgi:hypothetical protein
MVTGGLVLFKSSERIPAQGFRLPKHGKSAGSGTRTGLLRLPVPHPRLVNACPNPRSRLTKLKVRSELEEGKGDGALVPEGAGFFADQRVASLQIAAPNVKTIARRLHRQGSSDCGVFVNGRQLFSLKLQWQ